MLAKPRISKRKHQQHGTSANQKLGHVLRPKTIARRQVAMEALYVDRARIDAIGINPKYRNAIDPFHREVAVANWGNRAAAWNVDHDVTTKPKVQERKSRRRRKAPRAMGTYRAERRNAAPKVVREPMVNKPTHSWPQPDFAKLAAKARLARRAASIAA